MIVISLVLMVVCFGVGLFFGYRNGQLDESKKVELRDRLQLRFMIQMLSELKSSDRTRQSRVVKEAEEYLSANKKR